mgnify:FL=1
MSDNVKNAVITETDKEIEWKDKEIYDILIEFDDEVTKRKDNAEITNQLENEIENEI